jgi:hypothetical protein
MFTTKNKIIDLFNTKNYDTIDRKQESKDRKQESKDRKQESRDRKQESRDRKQESRDRKQESRDRKQESRDRKQESRDRKQKTRDSKQDIDVNACIDIENEMLLRLKVEIDIYKDFELTETFEKDKFENQTESRNRFMKVMLYT